MTATAGLVMVNIAYLMLISATFNKKMLHVRGLLMLSSFMFAGFGFIVGIASIAGWNLVIGALNTRQFANEIRCQRRVLAPTRLQDPYGEIDAPGNTAQPHLVLTLAVSR